MKDIYEIAIHGRAGQGAKTASYLLVLSAIEDCGYVQAFPQYGPERGGAPVQVYTRISKKPITLHTAIDKPDLIAVLDETLLPTIDFTEMEKDSVVIINSASAPDELSHDIKFKGKVYCIDATKIALDSLGRNIPNIPMVGAIIKITDILKLESVASKFKLEFTKKLGDEMVKNNINALKRGFSEVRS